MLLNKATARAYYGCVNNKLPPFSTAILVLPLPDANGVTQQRNENFRAPDEHGFSFFQVKMFTGRVIVLLTSTSLKILKKKEKIINYKKNIYTLVFKKVDILKIYISSVFWGETKENKRYI